MRLGHLKDEPVSVVEAEPRSRPRRPGRDRATGARACVPPPGPEHDPREVPVPPVTSPAPLIFHTGNSPATTSEPTIR